jgi:ferric-dicitrate binding protein FerR (iron transport regulator)
MKKADASKYYDKLVLRKLMGISSREEDTVLEAWLNQNPRNRESFESLRMRWQADKQIIPDDELPRRRRRKRTVQQTSVEPAKKRSTAFYVFEGLALASLIVAAVLIFMGLKDRPSIHHAGRDGKTVLLPDSSAITMKPGSVLLVASDFGMDSRTVELEGEAFVEVRPDSLKPFALVTENSRIEVTGTSFVVNSPRQGEYEDVLVLAGQLRILALTNPEKPVAVSAGKKARFDHLAGTITVSDADTANALAWKDKRLVFDKTPLSQVVHAIEEYFDIPVQVENKEMLKCTFTKTFADPRIEDVMKALREGLDVIVMREYERIVIDGRNSCP